MSEAADKLIGEHDFRNFCKMDVGNGVVNYMRRIVKADIAVMDERYSIPCNNKKSGLIRSVAFPERNNFIKLVAL